MRKEKRAGKAKKHTAAVWLFIISMLFVGIAAAFGVVAYNYMANQEFRETFYCVSSLKANNKIRVIQISDLHEATFGNDNEKLVERVKKLKPDLILYTGDCVDSDGTEDAILSLCKRLAEVAPSYYIYGNNEVERYYKIALTQENLDARYNFDDETRDPKMLKEAPDPFEEKLEETGVKVLKNEYETITIGATKVDVYGVLTSNPSAFWSYGGESFNEYLYTEEGNLKITAIHEPLVFEEFTPDTWGDLMLAGHTHGGLTKIPLIGPAYTPEGGFLPARGGHYVYGRYDVQGRPLIVNSGLDNSSYLRINNSPEIAIVDINKF